VKNDPADIKTTPLPTMVDLVAAMPAAAVMERVIEAVRQATRRERTAPPLSRGAGHSLVRRQVGGAPKVRRPGR